jgi:branched-chain amino acid transport system permease protein
MPRTPLFRVVPYALVVGVAATLPLWVAQPYYLHILILVGLWSIAALGVRGLLQIGQSSFGQAGFMAIGAYASAFFTAQLGLNFWLALPLSALVAGVLAVLFGYPALRLRGPYFAIATMAFGLAIRQILILPDKLTGGLNGFPRPINPPEPIRIFGFSIIFEGKVPFYYLVGGLLVVTALFVHRLDGSRLGAVSRAIRENDILASSVGINVLAHSVVIFMISGFLGGLAGAVWTSYFQFAQPDFFGIWQSVFLVAYVVVGGRNQVLGPIVGSLFLVGGFELLSVTERYQTIAYGAVIILAQGTLPGGLMSLPGVIRRLAAMGQRRLLTRWHRGRVRRVPSSKPTIDQAEVVTADPEAKKVRP